jgi:hypothetical protein
VKPDKRGNRKQTKALKNITWRDDKGNVENVFSEIKFEILLYPKCKK